MISVYLFVTLYSQIQYDRYFKTKSDSYNSTHNTSIIILLSRKEQKYRPTFLIRDVKLIEQFSPVRAGDR